jgi:hypothetical protein
MPFDPLRQCLLAIPFATDALTRPLALDLSLVRLLGKCSLACSSCNGE